MTLFEFRTRRGLTQADVATGISASVPAISDYENGRRIPKQPIMARIYEFTDGVVTPNDFHGVPSSQ